VTRAPIARSHPVFTRVFFFAHRTILREQCRIDDAAKYAATVAELLSANPFDLLLLDIAMRRWST
jgi:hypothetical protein